MTRKQEIFYGIALALIFTAALIVEGAPLAALGMIGCSGLSVRVAERG